jgi:hypothetical protein
MGESASRGGRSGPRRTGAVTRRGDCLSTRRRPETRGGARKTGWVGRRTLESAPWLRRVVVARMENEGEKCECKSEWEIERERATSNPQFRHLESHPTFRLHPRHPTNSTNDTPTLALPARTDHTVNTVSFELRCACAFSPVFRHVRA